MFVRRDYSRYQDGESAAREPFPTTLSPDSTSFLDVAHPTGKAMATSDEDGVATIAQPMIRVSVRLKGVPEDVVIRSRISEIESENAIRQMVVTRLGEEHTADFQKDVASLRARKRSILAGLASRDAELVGLAGRPRCACFRSLGDLQKIPELRTQLIHHTFMGGVANYPLRQVCTCGSRPWRSSKLLPLVSLCLVRGLKSPHVTLVSKNSSEESCAFPLFPTSRTGCVRNLL